MGRGWEAEALEEQCVDCDEKLEPDMERAAISGRNTSPKAGSKTPAAMGRAMVL